MNIELVKWKAELAYWLGADFRGKGIMPQVLKMFVHVLFMEHGMHRVWARPFEQNESSRKVLQKAGFAFEGLLKENVWKGNQYLNSTVYALTKY